MSLAEVRFQRQAQRRLQLALRSDRTPHAYVFHGPDGVGKEMLATAFARVLLCGSRQERRNSADSLGADFVEPDGGFLDACGECRDCDLMRTGNHPDFHLIYRELIKYHHDSQVRTRGKAIYLSVEVIREFLIATAGNRPAQGRAKVYLVREAERMNPQAQNALLKTLEEPPADTYILLLSSSVDRLLPTTRSRSQMVPFGPLPVDFIRERLLASETQLSRDQAHFLAAIHEGRLGPALEAAENQLHEIKKPIIAQTLALTPGKVAEWAQILEEAGNALADNISQRRTEASESDLKRAALRTLFAALAYAFDDALRCHVHPRETPAHADQAALMDKLARRLDGPRAADAVRCVASAERHLGSNVNVRLCLEGLGAELTQCLSGSAAPASAW